MENNKRIEDWAQFEQYLVDEYNQKQGHLNDEDGYNCTKCKNRGDFEKIIDGHTVVIQCECMQIRRSIKYMRESGLEKVVSEKTFGTYQILDKLTENIKLLASNNINTEKWFFIGGQTGSGKTHICTAIAGNLLRKGKKVLYKPWVELMREFKSDMLKDGNAFNISNNKVFAIDNLYIDDLFKGKITETDLQITWTIIDYRYRNRLKTVLSSEYNLTEISGIDESLAGRIAERCGEYIINIAKDKKYNRRLNGLKNGI